MMFGMTLNTVPRYKIYLNPEYILNTMRGTASLSRIEFGIMFL